ncbi:MAG: NAD-dependent epimerase/dehydratase family protein [Candidatus Competibacteraceae bacterium]
MQAILVTGATSQVGRLLLPKLVDHGYQVLATSRRAAANTAEYTGVTWLRLDLQGTSDFPSAIEAADTLIHLAPVYALPDFLANAPLYKLKRLVVFSTTSAITKATSTNIQEQAFARRILQAETSIQQHCNQRHIGYSIFRPTMTYGLGTDNNVAFIARFIHRYRFFPLVGRGTGKRQPVHAADLAQAGIAVLENQQTYGRIYHLGGGEILTYRAMVERIFTVLGQRPLILRIPRLALRLAIQGLSRFKRFEYLTPGMAERMKQDMVFDIAEAIHDFGYKPRGFRPSKSELISHG